MKDREEERDLESSHLLVYSLTCCLSHVDWEAEAGSPELNPSAPRGWQGGSCLSHQLLLPRVLTGRKLGLGVEPGSPTAVVQDLGDPHKDMSTPPQSFLIWQQTTNISESLHWLN